MQFLTEERREEIAKKIVTNTKMWEAFENKAKEGYAYRARADKYIAIVDMLERCLTKGIDPGISVLNNLICMDAEDIEEIAK